MQRSRSSTLSSTPKVSISITVRSATRASDAGQDDDDLDAIAAVAADGRVRIFADRLREVSGIVANGSVRATVDHNDVEGAGPVPYIAQNGIQIGFGATGTVESNTVADNWYTGPSADTACGLLFYEADGVKQRKNVFTGNQRDVCNVGRGGGNVTASR